MLSVVSSDHIRRLKKLKGLQWVYIGTHRGRERAEKVLDKTRRRFIGKDIEEIADLTRDNFIDYIGKLSLQQEDKVLWYSSAMASKSVLQTSIFHQYIYQKLLERLSKKTDEDILVVTDDNELLENTKRIGPEGARLLSSPSLFKRQKDRLKGCQDVLMHILQWFICRPFKNSGLERFDIFIHTWMDERSFSDLPRFTDSYFGRLHDFLTEKGYRIARLSYLRLGLRCVFKLRRHFDDIVYPLSYLPLKDLAKSIFRRFNVTIDEKGLEKISDTGILKALVRNEVKKANISRNYSHFLMIFYSYQGLRPKVNPRASFIYPFENQPWEKMLNLAFAQFKRIAYQHSIIYYNRLDYRMSEYEKEAPLPEVILATGKKWGSFLKRYYHDSTVEEAGVIGSATTISLFLSVPEGISFRSNR